MGWSATGGDLRVAHIIGMHALQALPLLAIAPRLILAAARLGERTRIRIVVLAAFAYTAAVALTPWRAVRGQPLAAPDVLTTLAALMSLLMTGAGAVLIARTERHLRRVDAA